MSDSPLDSPIIAFTDGAAKGNPGPGGWGAIVVTPGRAVQHVTELGGGLPHTTNNRMELSGAIRPISAANSGTFTAHEGSEWPRERVRVFA